MPRGRKPKNAAEQSTEKKVQAKTSVAKAAKSTDVTKKFIYVFFNCDEEKSHESMNIFYNHAAFKSTAASRKALWSKLQEEEQEGRIQFLDKEAASNAVLSGEPQEASQFLKFGAIEAIPCE